MSTDTFSADNFDKHTIFIPINLQTWNSFPESIPVDTAVPGWAYENVTARDTFDVNSALADNAPESTATDLKTTVTGTSSASNGSATSASSGSNNRSGTATRVIAAGTVAGIAGTLLLLMAIRSRARAHSEAMKKGGQDGTGTESGITPLIIENGFSGYDFRHASILNPISKRDEKKIREGNDASTSRADENEHARIDQTANEHPAPAGQASSPNSLTNIIDLVLATELEHADSPPQYVGTLLPIV